MASQIYGRWDLTVGTSDDRFPSWVELNEDGGQFVGRVGSARPLRKVSVSGTYVGFALPKQYESRDTELVFEGEFLDGRLVGTTTLDDGREVPWTGEPAPALPLREVTWGEPIELIGDDLGTWTPRSAEWINNWSIQDGMLVNSAVGSDLITTDTFGDFRLVAEYRYPTGSNSGIYLRGRYEFQILDDYDSGANGVGSSGAIYGFIAPNKNAILPANEWNRAEITLIGRYVTVVLNGETVIDAGEIPGITGGALESREGEPGPIFVQGDHGPVTFRRLTLTRAR